jgi:hypothetical protein
MQDRTEQNIKVTHDPVVQKLLNLNRRLMYRRISERLESEPIEQLDMF